MFASNDITDTRDYCLILLLTRLNPQLPAGFPAGFHLLGGGVEGLWGGGSSLGVGGLRVIKNKVSKKIFLGGVPDFWGESPPPPKKKKRACRKPCGPG